LGSANLLYLALKLLEYDQLANEGAREHTFLAIEEPEAHLHPQLQRLVFRNYLATRTGQKPASGKTTVLMTTHSPHVASVTPIRSLVLLRRTPEGNASEAVSTAKLPVTASEVEDLERYLDVTRAEVLFAKAVILVEGDAERFLIPSLARRLKQPVQLDERGITVCSVAGTMFAPYLKLVGPKGLGLPFTVLTDMDPQQDSKLGIERLRHQILPALGLGEPKELEGTGAVDANVALLAETEGVFLNEHTLEVDLFRSGYERAFDTAMKDLSDNGAAKRRMTGWAGAPMTLKPEQFLDDINAIGKGRFAQRLAALIDASKDGKCPPYIEKGLRHVGSKCY
jgi:putative ATP-dependent endonuclease of OLD family